MFRGKEVAQGKNPHPVVHCVLRVPTLTRIEGYRPLVDTIRAHDEIAQKDGTVSVAKFGASIVASTAQRLNEQIRDGVRTLLILVVKSRTGHVGYQAPLLSVHLGPPTEKIKKSAPLYYRGFSYAANVWFTVHGPFERVDLTQLQLVTTKKSLLEVLASARTPWILVEKKVYPVIKHAG